MVIPLHTSRFTPWVYEAYKPFYMTHMIFKAMSATTDKAKNEEFYNLSFLSCGITEDMLIY